MIHSIDLLIQIQNKLEKWSLPKQLATWVMKWKMIMSTSRKITNQKKVRTHIFLKNMYIIYLIFISVSKLWKLTTYVGSLNERLVYMKAMKQANLNMNRYPGLKNSDVFYQMIDLDKGVYGHAFLVSLFIHVKIFFKKYIPTLDIHFWKTFDTSRTKRFCGYFFGQGLLLNLFKKKKYWLKAPPPKTKATESLASVDSVTKSIPNLPISITYRCKKNFPTEFV